MSATTTPRTLAVIVHADVAGSTQLVQRDETLAHERITDTFHRLSSTIRQYGGVVHEIRGDALLAEFFRVSDAVSATLKFQQANIEHNAQFSDNIVPTIRIGISLGEVVIADKTITGPGVVLAQRLEQLAEPGGVCIQSAVYEALPQRLPYDCRPMGEQHLKGFDEPVRAYAVTVKTDAEIPSPESRASPSYHRWIVVALLTIILLISGVFVWMQSWKRVIEPASITQMAHPLRDRPSIAVLPFVNMSGDKEQEYFSDGISEDIIIDLSRVSNLEVIARNSSFYYKGRSVKTEDVGRELGVQYVLAGSVRKSGDRVRVTAQLVDSTDARQLWADKFDRKLEDIFALQDEITAKIVSALVVQLSAREKAELALKATRNVAAYDLFLRGRQLDRLGTKEGMELAQGHYREAIQFDPRFSRAYGALARTLTRAMIWGFTERSAQGLNQALELAQQAVSLDGSSPQTHWVLGYVHLHRHEAEPALSATQRSIELAPNFADGYALLALINNHAGRGQEAIRMINHAMALNPHYTWEYPNILGRGYYNLADYRKAVELFLDALARNEIVGIPRLFLISSYVRLGQLDDAQWEVAQLQTHNPQMTLSQLRRQALIWDKEALERFLSDLEKVGVAP